jgi:hypothetical protein
MDAALSLSEQAAEWPHLTPQQRKELEIWQRARAHAAMENQPIPTDPQPWPSDA